MKCYECLSEDVVIEYVLPWGCSVWLCADCEAFYARMRKALSVAIDKAIASWSERVNA